MISLLMLNMNHTRTFFTQTKRLTDKFFYSPIIKRLTRENIYTYLIIFRKRMYRNMGKVNNGKTRDTGILRHSFNNDRTMQYFHITHQSRGADDILNMSFINERLWIAVAGINNNMKSP